MDTLESFLNILDRIEGLPAIALVAFTCIIVGYVWRFIRLKWFPNEVIPIIVMLWGAFFFSFIADPRATNVPVRVWFVRNVLIGIIVGFVSWMFHALVLKRIEDWVLSKMPKLSDTTFFTEKNPPSEPNPAQPKEETKP